MRLWRAWSTLAWLSFRRLIWSANTLMVVFPLVGCALFLIRRGYTAEGFTTASFESFTDFVIFVFASFIVPILTLAYGTASIGGDREDRTLVFLLVRPIPRWLILAAKFAGTLPLALGLVIGSFYLYCHLAGEVGSVALRLYLGPLVYMTVAYLGLFQLFAVSFRHATIFALIYAVFMELLLGNLPGIIKRVAVSYYGRSLIYQAGKGEGLRVPSGPWFEPMDANTATWMLLAIGLAGLLLAMVVFSYREYRDLT